MSLQSPSKERSHTHRGARSFVATWLPTAPEISGYVMNDIRPGRAPEVGTSHSRFE